MAFRKLEVIVDSFPKTVDCKFCKGKLFREVCTINFFHEIVFEEWQIESSVDNFL